MISLPDPRKIFLAGATLGVLSALIVVGIAVTVNTQMEPEASSPGGGEWMWQLKHKMPTAKYEWMASFVMDKAEDKTYLMNCPSDGAAPAIMEVDDLGMFKEAEVGSYIAVAVYTDRQGPFLNRPDLRYAGWAKPKRSENETMDLP